VGSRGLAIAMMANEPTHTSKATAIFNTATIKKGGSISHNVFFT
jgi:hypothetical protein